MDTDNIERYLNSFGKQVVNRAKGNLQKAKAFFQKPLGLGLKQFGKDLLGNVKQDIIDTINETQTTVN